MYKIAIVGAGTLLGKELKDALMESSLTAADQPPVPRIARAANTPSAGFPIAIDFAIVFGT